ncbi:hypothetical protein Bca4012_065517 [Brassica carinata]|uniref:Ubiquitin-like protease family profile domain-containing protein n=1 Tax=Brassica carinata TaxID=52824 RepID=A0A8X7VND0_BRACI|nr:hypothetical protein Bca52824_017836 [Brassica carinata]
MAAKTPPVFFFFFSIEVSETSSHFASRSQVSRRTPLKLVPRRQLNSCLTALEYTLSALVSSKPIDSPEDMDAMMYLFQERTSLRRWKPDHVAFMSCLYSTQLISAYGKFEGNRRGYKVANTLLEYGQGRTPDKKKDYNVKQYTVSYVPMRGLNMSGNDCGAYALKFIECHLLGLDLSLINDENIQEARHKIAYDLWEAANDEVLQYRMSRFKPPQRAPGKTVELN